MMPVPSAPPPAAVRFGGWIQRSLQSLVHKMGPPQFEVMTIVAQRWRADALGALTRVGVPDALAGGPRDVDELAVHLGLDVDALYRVLRGLARDGLFTESGRRFGLTALTEPLRRDHPHSMANMVMELSAGRNTRVWSHLPETLRTGASAWQREYPGDLWSFLDQHPDEHAIFHGAMAELTREGAPAFARAWDFGSRGSVVDLGGGTGTLLSTILCVHPRARGVLVDSASVVAGAPQVLDRFGVRERCEITAGDVISGEVPAGHGVYVAKNIAHGFSDALLVPMLRRWRAAMGQGARLVLIDVVVPGAGEPYLAFLDLQMLVAAAGGRERTEGEFREVLRAGGFTLETVVPTASPMSLVVAAPA